MKTLPWILLLAAVLFHRPVAAAPAPLPSLVVTPHKKYLQDSEVKLRLEANPGAYTHLSTVVADAQSAARGFRPHQSQSVDWQLFVGSLTLDLGKEEGRRDIWVGAVHSSGQKYWQRVQVFVDRTPPELDITGGITEVTSDPISQIIGQSPEGLTSITYRLVNAHGPLDGSAQITDRRFSPVSRSVDQTTFQCYDLPLTPGTNFITLTATDLAGNTASHKIKRILDYAADSAPPEIRLDWPEEDSEIYASTFRARGKVNEPGSRITVLAGDKAIKGIVERDGHFWVSGIPVTAGAHSFILSATDPAGNEQTMSFTVVRSEVDLTIDEPSEAEKASRYLTITGTISHPGYEVWVNGRKAEMNGKRWSASGVMVNRETGTAVVQAMAIKEGAPRQFKRDRNSIPTLQDMGNPKALKRDQNN